MVRCILRSRLVAAKGSGPEQSAVETALNEPVAIRGIGARFRCVRRCVELTMLPASGLLDKRQTGHELCPIVRDRAPGRILRQAFGQHHTGSGVATGEPNLATFV